MANYIFTTGTCNKSDFYSVLINVMVQAGWVNAASNPDTDFDVMTSVGEGGDKKLVIQLRPLPVAGTAAQSIITSDYNIGSYRLIGGYTPGNSGQSGVFSRPAEAWTGLYLTPAAASTTVPGNAQLTYKIHANKNRVIFILEYPSPYGFSNLTYYIGLPDETYCSEPNSRGLLVASSTAANTANKIHVTDAVGEMPSGTSSTTRDYYCTLAPKNPNSSGKIMLSEIYYGNASEGTRGKLTGIFALLNAGVATGDIINIGASKYYITVNHSYGSNAFPSLALAIQVE